MFYWWIFDDFPVLDWEILIMVTTHERNENGGIKPGPVFHSKGKETELRKRENVG